MHRTFHLQPEELSNGGKGYLYLIDSAEFDRTPLFNPRREWALFAHWSKLQDLQAGDNYAGASVFPNTSTTIFSSRAYRR